MVNIIAITSMFAMRRIVKKATLTFYNDKEDSYGETTARRNEGGNFKAIAGSTIAVDPTIIPYGSKVRIPSLSEISLSGDGIFYAHDTGSAVVNKVASKARGNDYPVIDVFMLTSCNELLHLNERFGNQIEYEVI